MKKKRLSFICAFVALCFIVSLAAGCAPSRDAYAVFAADCGKYIAPDGQTVACSPPYVLDSVMYICRDEAVSALNLNVAEDTDGGAFVKLGKTLVALPDADENGYISVTALCESLGLFLSREGGIFSVSLSSDTVRVQTAYSDYSEVLGYSGFTDKAELPDAAFCVDPYVRYTYEQMTADIETLCSTYPELINSFVIGSSSEGRDIPAFTLGRGNREIAMLASIHGCEFFTTNFIMYLADRYAYAWKTGELIDGMDCRALLNEVRFVIVPMFNPDGVNIAQNGPNAAKNPADIYSMDLTNDTEVYGYGNWKANANGVDLNRNYPLMWSNSNGHYRPGARYYFGPYAASEPETQAMIKLLENTPLCMLTDFHTFGESVNWCDSIHPEQFDTYREATRAIVDYTGYYDYYIENVGNFGGYLTSYVRDKYDVLAMCIELTDAARYAEWAFDYTVGDIWPVGLVMAQQAIALDGQTAFEAFANGMPVLLSSERSVDEGVISRDELVDIFGACGISPTLDGEVLTLDGAEFPLSDFAADDQTKLLFNTDSGGADAVRLLASLGIHADYDSSAKTLNLEYWR